MIGSISAGVWTEYLWYDSISLTSVWRLRFLVAGGLGLAGFVVSALVMWGNLAFTDRISPRSRLIPVGVDDEMVERFQEWVEPRLRRVRIYIAVAFGLVVGLATSGWRDDLLLFLNAVPFGETDPVFNRDIGFYVFELPFIRDVVSWLFNVVGLTTLLVTLVHYLNGGIQIVRSRAPRVASAVKAHLSVLVAVLAILRAIGYRLDAFELNFSERGVVFGAGYTDIKAHLPALNLLALISLLAAGLLIVNIRRRGWLLPAVAIGGWLLVQIFIAGIYPAVVQRFRVDPSELSTESEFISRNIEFTRKAYALSDVDVRTFAASGDLAASDIEANAATLNNLRLWDPSVLTTTYSQLQEIRSYYRLDNVDTDRYVLDGELTQVMIAPRELDEANLPARSWQTEMLVYTHGYGAVISPANAVAEQGQPAFLVEEVPPVASAPELEIAQPGVYFGETYAIGRPVIVNSRTAEVDYPLSGEDFQEAIYTGEAGVRLSSIGRRLAFAMRYFFDLNILISDQVTDDSRVLMVRNIRERIHKAAPFLHVDADPYLVLVDGRMSWVLDLYTVSDRYPYSTPSFPFTRRLDRATDASALPSTFNYIRNSVKATVDAYDGTVTFYIIDQVDPIIKAYRDIYPDLFVSGADVPPDLRAHFRYPEDLFRVQSDAYRTYHMLSAQVFYAGEDAWSISEDPSNTGAQTALALRGDGFTAEGRIRPIDQMLPYYLLMKLPNEADLSYLILQPFTPREKRNMTGFLVAKSDPVDYGKMIDFRMPPEEFVDGPGQVSARIDQDTAISAQLTLLDQRGSSVLRGNMLVVPIEDAVLYIQPLYLKGDEGGLPEFKSVLAVYQEKVVMEDTLPAAMAAIFGGDGEGSRIGGEEPTDAPIVAPGEVGVLLSQAEAKFAEAARALSRGDLGAYQRLNDEAAELVAEAVALLNSGG